jgi:hypothetical protein
MTCLSAWLLALLWARTERTQAQANHKRNSHRNFPNAIQKAAASGGCLHWRRADVNGLLVERRRTESRSRIERFGAAWFQHSL